MPFSAACFAIFDHCYIADRLHTRPVIMLDRNSLTPARISWDSLPLFHDGRKFRNYGTPACRFVSRNVGLSRPVIRSKFRDMT